MKTPLIAVSALVCAVVALTTSTAFSQARTYQSLTPGTYNWSDGANWVGGNAPDTAAESATFASGPAGGNITVVQDAASLTVGSINLNAGSSNSTAVLTFSGNAITLTGSGINRGANVAGTVNFNTDLVLGGNGTAVQTIASFSTTNYNGNISGNTLTMAAAGNSLFSGVLTTTGLTIRGSTTSGSQSGSFRAANTAVLGSFSGPITFQGGTTLTQGQGGTLETRWTSGTGTVASSLNFGNVSTTVVVNATSNTTGVLQLVQARGGTVDFTTNSITNGSGDRALRVAAINTGSGNATVRFSGSSWNITRGVEIGGTGTNTSNIVLDLANTSGIQTISGNITTTAGGTGTATLLRSGVGGTTILSGTNTYTNVTQVTGGRLLINGNSSGATGAVTVTANGILGGNGTVGGATTITGSLDAGNLGAGTLTFANGLNIAGVVAGGLLFDLDTVSDFVNVTAGGLTLGTLANDRFTWNLGGGFAPGVYTLFSANSISGSVSGDTFTLGGYEASLSLDGNNVLLTVVPEPSTWAFLISALLFGAVILRRRRHLTR